MNKTHRNWLGIIATVISIGTIYLYVATIWAQFGYNSYFSIPSNFISFSIRENTIFFRILVQGFWFFVKTIPWYAWLLIVAILVVSYIFPKIRIVVYAILIFFAALFLWKTETLGDSVARTQSGYFTLADNCTALGTTTKYFIPAFYNEDALLVPYTIDQTGNKKMSSGFMIKDLSQLPCSVVYDYNFGKVEQ